MRAHLRPSAIAVTTRDCPSRASPQAYTRSNGGAIGLLGADVAAAVELQPELLDEPVVLGMLEADGEQHEIGLEHELAALARA